MPVARGAQDPTRAYLLGLLDGPDMEVVEERLFTDDAYLDHIEDLEDQLIEEYLRRELSAAERSAFEGHFLSSPRRRRRMELTNALIGVSNALKKPEPRAQPSHWFSAMFPQHWLPYRVALTATAIVAVLSLGLSGWLALQLAQERNMAADRQRDWALERQKANNQIAQLQREQATRSGGTQQTSGITTVFSFALLPGVFRDQTETILRIPGAAETIQLKLQTRGALTGRQFGVTLRRDNGDERWRSNDVRRTGAYESMASIPAAVLQPGRYLLTLSTSDKRGAAGVIDDYAFRVVRQ
jgi:hypothetical protein